MSDMSTNWKPAASRKYVYLQSRGMRHCGDVLFDPKSGRRATIDYSGRVQWWDVDGSGRMHAQAVLARELEAELAKLRADKTRIDWLADLDNQLGAVQLPRRCVIENIGSMRDAIDSAMRMKSEGKP